MEFVKGKLYQILNDDHLEGCVLEFIKENKDFLVFNVIKGNDNYMDFHGDMELSKNYFEYGTEAIPLIPTEDDIETEEDKFDEINRASHYNQGIEAIEYIESHDMNFNEGNVIKYVTRAKYKGTYLKDLKKARYYLDRLIANGENNELPNAR